MSRTVESTTTADVKRTALTRLFERANAEQANDRPHDAEATCRELLALDERHHGAWQLLGVLALRSGDVQAAIAHFERAVTLAPQRADCHHNLGFALRAAGRHAAAEAAFRQAITVDPDFVEAHYQLANVLRDDRRFTAAEASFRRVLALRGDHHQAANNLGVVLGELQRFDEAVDCFRRAAALKPDYVEALSNLGHALRASGRAAEAEAATRRAIALAPGFATAHLNLGLALQDLGRFDEALACFRRASALDPGNAKPAACEGILHLLRGNFASGWAKYEARWHVGDLPPRSFKEPQWRGEPLDGKTILLHAEQGFGDTIQFMRYAPHVAARGASVVLEVQAPLLPVAARIAGITVVARGDTLPAFDLHCPLLSLPLAFGTALDSIPDQSPYLSAAPERVAHWRQRLGGGGGLKVGIAWAGSPIHRNDRSRSMALRQLAPLFDVAGIRWFSLQVGQGSWAPIKPARLTDLAGELADFGETSAAIAALDVVITADTAVAHLAGALGKTTWVMLPFSPDWRWLLGRTDTPWYKSMRLFRQERSGDWDDVVVVVKEALTRFVAKAERLTTDSVARLDYAELVRDANEHRQAKRHAACEAALRRAVTIDSGNASAWHVLAQTRFELGDKVEAIELMQKAAALEPASAMILSDLGIMLHGAGRFAEALDVSARALSLNPDNAATHNSLGATLSSLDRLDDAIAAFHRALALNPNYFECWTNLGQAQQAMMRLDDAADSFRRALAIRQDYPAAQCSAAMLTLLRGDLPNGLTQFEWRWRLKVMPPREFTVPIWQGEPLRGKTILLHAEQGYGDTLQCLRFVPEVAGRSGRLVLELPRPLSRLATSLAGGGEIVTRGTPLPHFDVHCAFMSLPRVLGITLQNLPIRGPYLHPDPDAVERWSRRLADTQGLKVGLVWAGNPEHGNDRRRSIAIERLRPLLAVPGVCFFSLQVGERAGDLVRLPPGIVTDLAPELTDFSDSAAALANLDLLIAADTSVVHLAGALGRPCWMMLPFSPDWRWLTEREDSPWYPSLRLFRQAAVGDWEGVIDRVAQALAVLARHAAGGAAIAPSPVSSVLNDRYFAAVALIEAGRGAEAEAALRAILDDDRRHPATLRRLAFICHQRGDNAEAVDLLAGSLERDADNAEAHCNLGLALSALGRRAEAEASYRRGLAFKPASIDGLNNLGVLLEEVGRFDEAATCYRDAIARAPQLAQPHNNLGVLLKESGQIAAALEAHRRAIALDPALPAVHSNMLYTLNYDERVSPQALFAVHRAWGRIPSVEAATGASRFSNPPDPARRLRIGYLSGDFRHHSVAFFVEPLLEAHDRGAVEIFLYVNDTRADATTARIRKHADHWVPIQGVSDERAAERIRQDGIDILVDLSGHTSGNRMMLFARKPAPVAVSWLGYPHTTGLRAIDYRLTDAVADPPGEADERHTERLVCLAQGFLCYRPPEQAGPVAPLPALHAGHVTFGSFNNFAKLSPRTVALWARLLREVAGARLVLKAPQFKDRGTRERCAAAFAAQGIVAERIDILPPLASIAEHLALYGRIDIALDPLVYNGTTTTCEALWMGVPVVSLRGDRHAARVGASILTTVGLDRCVAAAPEHYLAIASELAADLPGLAALREGLRERLRASPLCDATGFAGAVEAAFRTVWQDWCTAQQTGGAAVATEVAGPAVAPDLDDAEASARRRFDASDFDGAEVLLRGVLDRAPTRAFAWFLLGRVRLAKADVDAAIDFLRKALALDAKLVPAHNDLGILLQNQGRLEEAEAHYRQAIALDGHLAESMTNLGAVLAARGRLADATSWYARAIAADGQLAPAHNNLGAALAKLDRPEEAEALHHRAIALKPEFADAHYNLGVALQDQGRFEGALACYDRAVTLKPDFVDARWNRALALLLKGDYAAGWREHEWRWRRKEQPPRSFAQPLWRGEPVEGRTILLHAEQGLGDTVQFMRYAPLVAARAARVVLQVQRPVFRLAAATFADIAQVIGDGDMPPPFDLHCPLLSLPLAFGTTLDTVPAAVPYLEVDPGAAARWRERLEGTVGLRGGLKIGLIWAGSPQHKNDRNRSIAFERLAPLFAVPGLRWFSLQVGDRGADLEQTAPGAITDISDGLTDFADTAAAIAGLDLVISVDTAAAHLAGALAKPAWVMLPFVPDWRWLIGREDNPWYPALHLFRQPRRGDWEAVVGRIGAALAARAGEGAMAPPMVSPRALQ